MFDPDLALFSLFLPLLKQRGRSKSHLFAFLYLYISELAAERKMTACFPAKSPHANERDCTIQLLFTV